jgi:hypothetical protein
LCGVLGHSGMLGRDVTLDGDGEAGEVLVTDDLACRRS